MTISTADLCDQHEESVEVIEPIFRSFGGREAFYGPITTILAIEDNSLVRQALSEPGNGRVLVVDSGGSLRCAMLGDRLAAMAATNGWSGVVVFGCVRDSAVLSTIDLGIKALSTHPKKSKKRNQGERDVPLKFAGVGFNSGDFLYADADGIILADRELEVG